MQFYACHVVSAKKIPAAHVCGLTASRSKNIWPIACWFAFQLAKYPNKVRVWIWISDSKYPISKVISANDSEWKKNILLHSYILTVHNMHNKGGGRFEMGVQNHRGSGGRESPSGVQGRSPGRECGGRSPPDSEEF